MHGRDLLVQGLTHRVGNGRKTRVWIDKWLDGPVEGYRAPWRKNYSFDVNLMADSLIDPSPRRWNMNALNDLFVLGDVKMICRHQPVVWKEDFHLWKFNKSGLISVKSAYWLAFLKKIEMNLREVVRLPSINPLKVKIWKTLTAPKIKNFLWKVLSDALPVAELIRGRGLKVEGLCQI